MTSFAELSNKMKIGIFLVVALLLSAALYFLQFQNMMTANAQLADQYQKKKAENDNLEKYRGQKVALERQYAQLQQQLEIQKKIVPDEKDADRFITTLQDTATVSGVKMRRMTAMSPVTREFYTELPFAVDIDGPYYAVLDYFDRLGKTERIINISSMQMASVTKPGEAKVRKPYKYDPNETVVASCVATTFYSHEAGEAPAPAKAGTR